MTIGQRIKYLREKVDLTQKDVATKLGVEPAAISKYELDMREPNIEALKNLGEIFNVSIDYLLGRTPDIFVGEQDKVEVDLLPIKKKYEDVKKNFNNPVGTYENWNSNAITLNELMCSVGTNIVGTVSRSQYISFEYIKSLLENFENAKLPNPQVLLEPKNRPNDIIIVESDCFDDEEMPLDATDRMTLYTAKLSKGYNVLGLSISIDKNENCKLLSAIYQAKGEDKYLPLKDLPKTVLTAEEYVDVMSRL